MRLEADGPPPPAWNGLIASADWPRVREALTLSQRSQLHGVLIALPAQARPGVVSELLMQVERMPFGPALRAADRESQRLAEQRAAALAQGIPAWAAAVVEQRL